MLLRMRREVCGVIFHAVITGLVPVISLR